MTGSLTSSTMSISGKKPISDVASTINAEGAGTTSKPANDVLFDPGDGDIRLVVNGSTIDTHKYIIKKFSALRGEIQNDTIVLRSRAIGFTDFQDALKILYASVVEGPFGFSPWNLIAALRVATAYDHPSLRNYAIQQLEGAHLCAIERIRLARELGIPSWEEPAYVELCKRKADIEEEEASVLGLDAFVQVARIRENEQRRKRRKIDKLADGGRLDTAQGDGGQRESDNTAAKNNQTEGGNVESASTVIELNQGGNEQEQVVDTVSETKQKETVVPQSSFTGFAMMGTNTSTKPVDLQHLETQQIAHSKDIAKLQFDVKQIKTRLSTLVSTPKTAKPKPLGSAQEEVHKWLTSVKKSS